MLDNLDDSVLRCPSAKAIAMVYLDFCEENPSYVSKEFQLKSFEGVKTQHWLSTLSLQKTKLSWRLSIYPQSAAQELYKLRVPYNKPYMFAELQLPLFQLPVAQNTYLIGFGQNAEVRESINNGEYVIVGAQSVKCHLPSMHGVVSQAIDILAAELKRRIAQCEQDLQE